MHPEQRKSASPKGFTLIELLVVIAIIAILAAILFPVFAKARENARKSTCLSNTKQIAIGCTMYFQDYDEMVLHYRYEAPGNTGFLWRDMIAPYIKSTALFTCPSARTEQGYGWNYRYLGFPGAGGTSTAAAASLAQITAPSETVMLGEANYAVIFNPWQSPAATLHDLYTKYRHMDGTNLGFVDGHAKWYPKAKVLSTPENQLWTAVR